MAIDVFESTMFEVLWAAFERSISGPPANPLAVETIVVPAHGWENWFSRRLAERRGCWANFRFLLSGQWMSELLEKALPTELAPKREPDTLTWSIATVLPGLLRDDRFAPVRGYLSGSERGIDPQRLIDLSRCIAGLFDRYLMARPELIAGWDAGRDWPESYGSGTKPPEAVWQCRLWRAVTEQRPFRSLVAMIDDLARIGDAEPGRLAAALPERVSVWLSGNASPVLLRFLEALGRHTQIGLFVVSPANEYWGDMRGRRQLLRELRDSDLSVNAFCAEHHLDLMHPLLGSMGRLSRHQQILMTDCDADPWQFHEMESDWVHAADQAGSEPRDGRRISLLRDLQIGIQGARQPEPHPLPRDSSVRIHSCHSAIREVEVLHDAIREALEEDRDLTPDGIAVLCPDLDAYVPMIQAVFGQTKPGQTGHIPFQIAGRSARRTRPVVDAWLRLLEVFESRFAASEILDLLSTDVVGKRAGFDRSDIDDLTNWVTDAGIRWGADAAHRRAEGQPGSDQNTWQFGLDRLLLGYAMPPGGGQLCGDVVAIDRVEGLSGFTLGRLATLTGRLRSWRERIASPRPLGDWQSLLDLTTQHFLDTSDDEAGLQLILDATSEVARLSREAGFDRAVPFAVAVREVTRLLDEASGGRVRLGGVTFCGLDAVRSLPFPVIALLGMNENGFPRSDRAVGFDLTLKTPMATQLGDSRPRDEDRHLFLEAVLAAGDRLIVTCQGQDVRDQRHRPPSVVVQELLDVLEQTDALPDGALPGDALPGDAPPGNQKVAGAAKKTSAKRATRRKSVQNADDSGSAPSLFEPVSRQPAAPVRPIGEFVFVRHPLQSFSPKYFDGSDDRLGSYRSDQLSAACRLTGAPTARPVFASSPLSGSDDDFDVRVEELRTVIDRPWRLFLSRLGTRQYDSADDVGDREPLLLQGLQRWTIGDRTLQSQLARFESEMASVTGSDPESEAAAERERLDALRRLLSRSGALPAGELGARVLAEIGIDAKKIVSAMQARDVSLTTGQLAIDLQSGEIRVTGHVDHWTGRSLHQVTFSKPRAKHTLLQWVDQLLVTVATGRRTDDAILIGLGGDCRVLPGLDPMEAAEHLQKLVELVRIARRWPLPFYADDSVLDPVLKSPGLFDDPDAVSQYVQRVRSQFVPTDWNPYAVGGEPDAQAAFAGRSLFDVRCSAIPEFRHFGDRRLMTQLVEQICVPIGRLGAGVVG